MGTLSQEAVTLLEILAFKWGCRTMPECIVQSRIFREVCLTQYNKTGELEYLQDAEEYENLIIELSNYTEERHDRKRKVSIFPKRL